MNEPEMIEEILRTASTIAVVGCSPNPARPSNSIARFLIDSGYEVIPVNPGHREILGRRCYPSLLDIPADVSVDIVDVFRNSSAIASLVEPALARNVRCFWMQEGVIDREAARKLEEAGVEVAMDRCILKEHLKYL